MGNVVDDATLHVHVKFNIGPHWTFLITLYYDHLSSYDLDY